MSVPVNPLLQPLVWLLGKWRSEDGEAFYSTMPNNVKYTEEIEFSHCGQPNLSFCSISYDPETNTPLHRESGFVRISPNSNRIAFVCAHNNGVTSVEEGEVNGQELTVKSHTIGRLTFGKEPAVIKTGRTIKLQDNRLLVTMRMETASTQMQDHLKATYNKM